MTPHLLGGHRALILGDNGVDLKKFDDLHEQYRLALPDGQALKFGRYEDFEGVLKRLEEYFESDEWHERLEHLEGTDWGDVEERMKAVEQRLRELEGALDE